MPGEEASGYNQPSLAPGQLRGGSWRPRSVQRWLTSRLARRVAITLIGVALVVWLAWLLAAPFRHPSTHLLVLTARNSPEIDAPAARYAARQTAAWQQLSPILEGRGEERAHVMPLERVLASPARWEELLSQAGRSPRAVVIVAVSAQAVEHAGQPVLLVRNSDLETPPPARLAVRELLETVSRSSRGTKLILLDLGDVRSDPREGMIVNQVAEQIDEVVQEIGDASLHVLVSHSSGETSQVSALLGQTVFGYFALAGLQGGADLDGDGAVRLGEYATFVTERVQAWVAQASAGEATQTPRLLSLAKNGARQRSIWLAPVLEQQPAGTRGSFASAVGSSRERLAEARSPFDRIAYLGSSVSPRVASLHSSVSNAERLLADPASVSPLTSRLRSAVPKLPAGQTSPARPKAAASADGKGDEGSKDDKGPSAAERAAQRLADAWSLRDELASRSRYDLSPVDFAPHLWRMYEARLLAAERMLRFGADEDARAVVAMLERELLPLDELYDPAVPPPDDPRTLAEQIAAALPRSQLPADAFPSLGAAVTLAALERTPLPENLAAVSASFEKLLTQPTAEALQEFLQEEAVAAAGSLREIDLARQLANMPEVDWNLRRGLLRLRYGIERAAAMPQAATPWLRERMLALDRRATEAQRRALDRVRPGWTAHTSDLIAQAERDLLQLEQDAAALQTIERLRNDLVFRAPSYVSLQQARQFKGASLAPLLEELDAMNEQLRSPSGETFAALKESAQRAARLATEWEMSWDLAGLRAAAEGPPTAGQSWKWETLLETPLVDAATRLRMIATLPAREEQLAERFLEPDAWREKQSRTSDEEAIDDPVASPRAVEAMMLLAAGDSDRAPIRQALEAARSTDARRRLIEDIWQSTLLRLDRAGEAVHALQQAHDRPAMMARLRTAFQLALVLDPRDAQQVEWLPIARARTLAREFDVVELGYERAMAARRGARPDELPAYDAAARAYLELAVALPGQPALADPSSPPLRVEVPAAGSLMESATVELPLTLESRRSYDVPVWLALDYDAAALAVETLGVERVYDVPKLAQNDVAVAAAFGPGASAPEIAESLVLPPGAQRSLRLRVRRVALPEIPARLVVYVATRESAARHAIEIELPTRPRMDLVVRGISGTWAESETGLRLQPFANRATTYEIDVASKVQETIAGEVQLFVPTTAVTLLPPGGVPRATAQRILARHGAGKAWGVSGKVTLAQPGTPMPLRFAPPKPEEGEAPPPAPPPAPPTDVPEGGAATGGKDGPTPLPFGLIAALIDDTLDRVVLVHVPAWPQRPTRFIEATAGYDEQLERVVVRVTTPSDALLPPGGVQVHADFGNALATGAQARTDDILQSAGQEVLLYGEVPPQQGRTVTVHVDIDRYPRAFTFEVPCFGDADGIAPQADRVSLEIARLPEGTAYRAPTSTIPVELRVDVPPTALLEGVDLLEIGIDQQRDRELTGDATVRLMSDRQADVELLPLGDEGLVTLTTRVGDLVVNVPTSGLQNTKADVLVHAVIGNRSYYSASAEVLLDSTAPRFDLPQLLPSRTVSPGTPITLTLLMIDDGGSGVDKVEVAIDAAGKGEFVENPAPVPAVQDKNGRWEAKLETKDLPGGTYTILVRASDRAGNVSGFMPLKGLTIRSVDGESADGTNTVSGVVMFGRRNLEGFEVTLASEPPVKLPPALTDANGRFTIKKVPPGKYKVTAKGVVRNKPSVGEQEITVAAPPAIVPPVELQVR